MYGLPSQQQPFPDGHRSRAAHEQPRMPSSGDPTSTRPTASCHRETMMSTSSTSRRALAIAMTARRPTRRLPPAHTPPSPTHLRALEQPSQCQYQSPGLRGQLVVRRLQSAVSKKLSARGWIHDLHCTTGTSNRTRAWDDERPRGHARPSSCSDDPDQLPRKARFSVRGACEYPRNTSTDDSENANLRLTLNSVEIRADIQRRAAPLGLRALGV